MSTITPSSILFDPLPRLTSHHSNLSRLLRRNYHCLSLLLLLIDLVRSVSIELTVPSTYTALDGDLVVQMRQLADQSNLTSNDFYLNLLRLSDGEKSLMKRIKIPPDLQLKNITNVTFGCQHFLYGGTYEFEIEEDCIVSENTTTTTELPLIMRKFHVGWSPPRLDIHSHTITTYPNQSVEVTLNFPLGRCNIARLSEVENPEYWLQVVYCGQGFACNSTISSLSHVLYTEQVRSFQSKTLFNLSCDLFGLAGQYAVQIKPIIVPDIVLAESFIMADWNSQYVFNVRDRSIFPCDSYVGVQVLFEYPRCIEFNIRDRVRVFGRLRADVTSLTPPTTLEYIAEKKIEENRHIASFDCDLFYERYVEYCFSYVTQTIFGAVAEIRVECVPTMPVSDFDNGGWGPWSEWTPCSTTCKGGKRHRYRFCDSPLPRYGAKFCQGIAVETQDCGQNSSADWKCLYQEADPDIFNSSATSAVDFRGTTPECRCGCQSHFGNTKEIKVFASSSNSCPGQSFWLITASDNHRVQLILDYIILPCPTQYIKIRNGPTVTSTVIADYEGKIKKKTERVASTQHQLLIEMYSSKDTAKNQWCNGRFLIRATQIEGNSVNASRSIEPEDEYLAFANQFTSAHLAAAVFVIIMILLSIILGIHVVFRYKKYQETIADDYTPAITPHPSLENIDEPPPRAVSTTTLISEVVYLVKRRRKTNGKHSILRESTISEASHYGQQQDKAEDQQESMESMNSGSSQTICKEIGNSSVGTDNKSIASYPYCESKSKRLENSHSSGTIKRVQSANDAIRTNGSDKIVLEKIPSCSKSITDEHSEVSSSLPQNVQSCLSSGSNITLTSGCYSPATGAVFTAMIRTTNQKECKEQQNRRKLLSRPESEFSLGNPSDLELDYYDYNVTNAETVPGSYLGMDPAYLVWIPPMEDESSFGNDNESDSHENNSCSPERCDINDILPRFDYIETGSNKESPCNDTILSTVSPTLSPSQKQRPNGPSSSSPSSPPTPYQQLSNNRTIDTNKNAENSISKLPIKYRETDIDAEKETTVTKSPEVYEPLRSFFDVDDIQFVDD